MAVLALGVVSVEAGHELPYLPSYYPQEIRLEVVRSEAAARRLQEASLHAFVGGDPFAGGALPADIGVVESLGGYVLAVIDGPSAAVMNRGARCALARRMTGVLSRSIGAFTFHPHPVTPYHADYLLHFDRVEAQKRDYAGASVPGNPPAVPRLRMRAKDPLAERLAGPWRVTAGEWDATLEHVAIDTLLASRGTRLDGWWGPPWLKEGWFDAFVMLIDRIRDADARRAAQATFDRLANGGYRSGEEQANLERGLVAALTETCEVTVLGYTSRREAFNVEFSNGVENVAFDSHTGLNSAVFIRTVKLKDFIWNGWLKIGLADGPAAAWNPMAGFTDPFGRLLWSAVGDPALLPAPYGAGWVANRSLPAVLEERGVLARVRAWVWARTGRGGTIPVPRDALIPDPGTGRLREVGGGKAARARITFIVLTSDYHDGTRMDVADVLYPYVFAYAWGGAATGDAPSHDAVVERSTVLMRDWLVGIKVVRIDNEVKSLADLKLSWKNPVVDVYLNAARADPLDIGPVTPPWASVPWHVSVLMEEAVRRRIGTFSEVEARRTGIEWLDLVRRPAVTARLAALVDEFERQAYVPEPLRRYVTADQARQRWQLLKRFYQRDGHFLVTNGPYRLEKWTNDAAVLGVFRDLSYPRGAGAFDRYPVPHRAYITEMTASGGRLRIRADVERVEKFQRSYQVVRGPLADAMLVGALKVRPVCRYIGIGLDGRVLTVGTAPYAGGGAFTAEMRAPPEGLAAVVAAVFLDENFMNPDVRMVRWGSR